jgi:predicted Zn-ribbon and HTH transcriptional regulator
VKRPATPRPARETVRQALRRELEAGSASARELSVRLRISERDVLAHLPHLERSLAREGLRLAVEPAQCLACGYTFEGRARFATPGRCPECRSERIAAPLFASRPRGAQNSV